MKYIRGFILKNHLLILIIIAAILGSQVGVKLYQKVYSTEGVTTFNTPVVESIDDWL